jgi:molybdopterin/thiamine biosynthesis adenylyltransferase
MDEPAGRERELGPDGRLYAHPEIGAAGITRLRAGGPVAVVGLGTVGARGALALGSLGVPLLLIDSGHVDPVNVGLQPYDRDDVGRLKTEVLGRRLRAIRPELALTSHAEDVRRLGLRLLAPCRLILGAVDSFGVRVWLAQAATHLGIPYLDLALDGTGRALYGRVSGYDPGGGSACYTCGWDSETWDGVSREEGGSGCAVLAAAIHAADASANATRLEPPPTLALPGLAEVVAGLGTIQAVRLLLGTEHVRVIGRECRINLSAGRYSEAALTRDPRCRSSHRPWTIQLLDRVPAELSLGSLFERAGRCLGGEVMLTVPDRPLVLQAACPACRCPVATARLREALPPCPTCQGRLIPLVAGLRTRFGPGDVAQVLDRTWAELGLPPGGAVCAVSQSEEERVFLFACEAATPWESARDQPGIAAPIVRESAPAE